MSKKPIKREKQVPTKYNACPECDKEVVTKYITEGVSAYGASYKLYSCECGYRYWEGGIAINFPFPRFI